MFPYYKFIEEKCGIKGEEMNDYDDNQLEEIDDFCGDDSEEMGDYYTDESEEIYDYYGNEENEEENIMVITTLKRV